MIYTCPNCGGYFDAKQFRATDGKQNAEAKCKYCGSTFNFKSIHTSHVVNGYNYLAAGEYSGAYRSFSYALELTKDEKGESILELAYVDAYLGRALAQFDVQVVYEEEVGGEEAPPVIICHTAHKERFEDCPDFQNAVYLIGKIANSGHRARQEKRLLYYADYIDGIKDMYDKLEREGKEYQLFVAYEDLSKDRAEAYVVAQKICKSIPSKYIDRIFCPDPDEAEVNMIHYEAKILYALNHSQCMLALVDRDVDNRLIEMYTQFDEIRRRPANRQKGMGLGFVRYSGQFQLHIGDRTVTENIFSDTDSKRINSFVLRANGMTVDFDSDEAEEIDGGGPPSFIIEDLIDDLPVGTAPQFTDENRVIFGKYPQSRENSQLVKKHFFDRFGRPSPDAPGEWLPLFTGKKDSIPYTWYVEDTVNDSRYRAVYFTRYREVYAVSENSPKPEVQRKNDYVLRDIHVFKYEPVIWNVMKRSEGYPGTANLIASMGLDAVCFNQAPYGNEFDYASLSQWMNREMLANIFSSDELSWLYSRNGLHLRLLDADIELDSPAIREKVKNYNIGGSDYFRCVGGSVLERNVNAYWVESDREVPADRAAVIFPSVDAEVRDMPLDCTTVAVVPTLKIRLPIEE